MGQKDVGSIGRKSRQYVVSWLLLLYSPSRLSGASTGVCYLWFCWMTTVKAPRSVSPRLWRNSSLRWVEQSVVFPKHKRHPCRLYQEGLIRWTLDWGKISGINLLFNVRGGNSTFPIPMTAHEPHTIVIPLSSNAFSLSGFYWHGWLLHRAWLLYPHTVSFHQASNLSQELSDLSQD